MLGLTLREEFRGKRLTGTAIKFLNDSSTSATLIAATQFLLRDQLMWHDSNQKVIEKIGMITEHYRLWFSNPQTLYGIENTDLA